MKTAGTETPNRRAHPPGNRAHGAGDQNRSRLISRAVKQEKFQPQGTFFPLTSTFIELIGTCCSIALIIWRLKAYLTLERQVLYKQLFHVRDMRFFR